MTVPLTAPAAALVGDMAQGSDEERAWRRRTVAPSDIAAITGTSPFQTIGELRRSRLGDDRREPLRRSDQAGLGQPRQPMLEEWFIQRFPQYRAHTTGYWFSTERDWQRVQPRRALIAADRADGPAPLLAALTFHTTPKTLTDAGWGPDGSTQIPADRYDQHQ
ncbi:hypothetical protein ACFU99_07735 [Streptomyces sp. NPDC057654]|uniref:hypothetical protein n=1 Tax=Streptomyces sp. NPDC057654 TaxID=3346196 RepID=UPI00369C1861